MKLALIIDKSESYIGFEKTNVLKSWGIEESEVENTESFSRVGEETIFGDSMPAAMSVNSLDQWKKLTSDIEKSVQEGVLETKVSQGLVITTTLARNSTKKAEEIIKKAGGKVILAKESAKDKTNVSSKMVSQLKLSKPVKDFLVEYAADDYELLVSIVQTMSEIPPEAQSRVSIEDLYIRLPKPPGAVPPWEIEKPLLKGDTVKTIELFRRITSHTHVLVVLSLLKTKFTLSWRIASLIADNPKISESQAAERLGVAKNYPFKLAYENAKRTGFDKISNVLTIVINAEANLKGGSSANNDVVMEIALMKIAHIFKK